MAGLTVHALSVTMAELLRLKAIATEAGQRGVASDLQRACNGIQAAMWKVEKERERESRRAQSG